MYNLHPTKQTLIKTVVNLLDSMAPEDITSEIVLEKSGISKGSLYHHFSDFSELIEQAQVYIYSRYVDQSIEALINILAQSKNKSDILERIKGVTRATQAPGLQRMRYNRIIAISLASKNLRMRTSLAAEQQRLTEALADLFREVQERGWGCKEISPMAVAVFIQAYTVGKVVDDFIPNRMSEEKWYELIDQILEQVIFCTDVTNG